MTSKEAVQFLVDDGESVDWALAVVMDALCDGKANLLKWDVIYDPENKFTVARRD